MKITDSRGNRIKKVTKCACTRCTTQVHEDAYTYPYCSYCYLDVDGKCD